MRNLLRTAVLCLLASATISMAQENPLTHDDYVYSLRMKGHVPPTSDPELMKQMMK